MQNQQSLISSGQQFSHISDYKTLLIQAYRCVQYHEYSGAERFFRQAQKLKPTSVEALAGLGQCLCQQHHIQEGLPHLRRAGDKLLKNIRKNPVARQDLQQLAKQLAHWGDIKTSLRYLHSLLTLQPASPVLLQDKALALSRINRLDEALQTVKKAHAILPAEPNIRILLAVLETKLGHLQSALTRLQDLVKEEHTNDILARAYLEMGGSLDKLQRYDMAFAAFEQSHALQASDDDQLSINAEQVFSRIAENRNSFNGDWLRERQQQFHPDNLPTPVFLLGFLRSGTTLTEQVLAAHPRIVTSDESDILAETIARLDHIVELGATSVEKLKRATTADLQELRQFYWRRVEQEHGKLANGQIYIEKNALNSISVGFINILFPEAKVIFCVRDPRDVCISCFMQSFTLSQQTAPLISWASTAKYYASVMDLWLTVRSHLTIEYLELRYEDAVSEFDATFRQVFDFLEVEWNSDVVDFHQQSKNKYIATPSFSDVAKPVYQTSKARWKNYSIMYEPVQDILAPYIEAYHYQTDNVSVPCCLFRQ